MWSEVFYHRLHFYTCNIAVIDPKSAMIFIGFFLIKKLFNKEKNESIKIIKIKQIFIKFSKNGVFAIITNLLLDSINENLIGKNGLMMLYSVLYGFA